MQHYLSIKKCTVFLICTVLISFVQIQAITITPKVNLNHPVIYADGTEVVYLLVQFDSPLIEIDHQTKPNLNLGMVIDRSGSMDARGKMVYAKKAAQYAIDQMLPTDRLAIVEYDEKVSVLWPSTPVETPELIKSRISELFPRGSTNLTGGMMKGVDEVLSSISLEGINRVLLLSDGLANKGVTDPKEIKRLVRNARKKGVTISTMGLGLEYNEDLMQMIAEYGGGNYYYIEDPKQMRNIYQQELGNLYATVCKNMKAVFRMSDIVTDCQIYGYINEKNDDQVSIDIGNIYSGEKLSLVIRMEIDAKQAGHINVGSIDFEYFDVTENKNKTHSSIVAVEATYDKDEIALAENKDVTVEAILVEADDYHDKQIKLFESGDTEEAQKNISSYAAKITSLNSSFNNVQLEKKIEAFEMESDRIQKAATDDTYKNSFLKSNKARFYQSKKGKRSTYLQQLGDSGLEVKKLQQALQDKGYFSGKIDGNYNDDVKIAIEKFQKDSNLKVDGIAGPKTLQLLGIY